MQIFIMKCMECMVLFNFIYEVFVQNFYWNIGETEVEIQIEVQEIVGPRWALLGFGRTHGSADHTLPPLATAFIWDTTWWVLLSGSRCRGFLGRFGLVCRPLLHVLRRTRSSVTLSVYSSCFLIIPDLCS